MFLTIREIERDNPMATLQAGGLRKVIIKLETRPGFQIYWGRDEYPLSHFEMDLERLFLQAGFEGVFKIRQVGRQLKSDTEEWGITLAPAQRFKLELYAQYSTRLPKKDVWEILFSDSAELDRAYKRLEAVLNGQVLLDEAEQKPQKLSGASSQNHSTQRRQTSGKNNKSYADIAQILLFVWGMIDPDERVRQGTLKEIFIQLDDERIHIGACSFQKALIDKKLLNREDSHGSRSLYRVTPEALKMLEDHKEEFLKSPIVQKKLQELRALAKQRKAVEQEIRELERRVNTLRARKLLSSTVFNQTRPEIAALRNKHEVILRAAKALPRIRGFLGKV